MEKPNTAISVLTKGYDNLQQYDSKLIPRNQSIYEHIYSKNKTKYQILIFHEGNIPEDHQKYIQSKTPDMPIIFESIESTFVKEDNAPKTSSYCEPTSEPGRWSIGYRNMCKFWFYDFLEYMKEYKYIIRIDEDCIIHEFPINLFDNEETYYIAGFLQPGEDNEDVIKGLKELTSKFLEENGLEYKETTYIPYTNMFAINSEYFRNLDIFKKFKDKVEETGCIFVNRWGDHTIWSKVLINMVPESDKHIKEDKRIKYFHGSHGWKINI